MIKSKVQVVLLSPQQGYLDVDPNTEVPFTFSVSNVKDLTQKNGTFSKTIKLSGTKNNNQLLNNYFDVNVIDGTFNINRLQKVQVLRGGVPVLKEGYLQLVSVEKVQNSSNSTEQLVEYNVLIKDTIADLFTKINPLELTDLEFGHLDHTYNAANVISSFSNTVANEYKYVLPYSDSPAYKLNQMKPGIFAKVYWDKIIDGAGFTYEWAAYSADTVQFDKLIIPYNGDELKVDQDYIDSIKVIASKSADTTYTSATTLTYDVETQDPLSAFDPATGIYTNQFYIDAANNLTFTYEVEYEIQLVNPSASAVTLYDLTTAIPNSYGTAKINYIPRLNLKKGNVAAGNAILSNTFTQFQKVEGAVLSAGTTSIGSYTKTVTLASNAALPTNTFKTEIDILSQQNNTFNQGSWRNGAGSTVATTTAVTVTAQVIVKNINLQIQPNLQSIAFNSTMRMNSIVPKKVKQSQFVKDIMTMYNLFVEVDDNDSNRLIFKSRDDYYDSGQEVDWTRKLAKNMKQQVTFLPQVTKKRLVMTYKHDDADVMLKGYKDNVNEVYGQVEYTFDSDYVKEVETKELGFSPVAVGQPSWGPVLPFINGVAPKTNIKIAINGAQYTNANSYTIENYPGSSATTTTYPLISHFDASQNPSFDLNWALNDYYYYGTFGAKTNNNLYNLYWRRTINQINKGRMLTAYFHLTEKDINRLKLNQKIFINNAWWNINQIIDYKAGKDELTKVELLSIDDSIKFVPFKTKKPRKPAKGDHTIRPIKEFNVGPVKETNVFITDSSVVATGKNNFFGDSVKNSTIVGDGNKIYSEKSMVIGDNNELNSDAVVFGDENIVNPDLKNVVILGNNITATTDSTLYAGNIEIQGTLNGYTIDDLISGATGGNDIYWTSGSTGTNSVRLNNSSGLDATGAYSIAIGSGTTASGDFSFVGGKSSYATGVDSLVYGLYNESDDDYQFVFGVQNSATTLASNAYVFGSVNIASNADTIAFGTSNNVSAASAKAFGANLTVSGTHSVAFGKDNTVSGIGSTATGEDNLISGGFAFVAGQGNVVTGDYSAVFGTTSKAAATNTYVFGDSITGATANTTYVDKLNIKTIGAGTPIINIGVDSSGNVVTGTTGSGEQPFVSGSSGSYSIESNNPLATATANYAFAQGTSSGTSEFCVAFGRLNLASGSTTFIHGDENKSGAQYGTVFGGANNTLGNYTFAQGFNHDILGSTNQSAILGGSTNKINASVDRSVILGGQNITATTSDTVYVPNLHITGTTTGVPCDLSFCISDETSAITTGTSKITLYAPYAFTITDVKASLSTSGSTVSTFDVNVNGTSIFSTRPTIDANEFTTATAAAPSVITASTVSSDVKITVDIDGAGTGAKGAKIYILGKRT